MAEISAKEVNDLRKQTGLGLMECKALLKEAGADFKKALLLAKERGVKLAQNRSERAAKAGRIETYIHHDGKTGALVEVNCETDFVARNEEFRTLCKNIALQVVAANPVYVRREDLPAEAIDERKRIIQTELKAATDPPADPAAEAEKKLGQWFAEVALLDQPFVKDPSKSIRDMILEVNARTGENVSIARFARFLVGEVPLQL
ncbi:MAG TPA: elongation factor Ts [Isosphaeraceae bacterium]|nr:elongation factor Ts [Isosphaeraceae bacterium]